MSPGDRSIVRRVIAAVLDVIADRIVDALDQPSVDRQPEQGRKKTLGRAVGRVYSSCVSPLSHDVAGSVYDAVGPAAFCGRRPEKRAKLFNLSGEISRYARLLSFGKRNRLFKQVRIHAYRFGSLLLPAVSSRGIVARRS